MISIIATIPGGSTSAFGTDPQIDVTGDYNGGTCIDGQRYAIAPAGIKGAGSTPTPGTVDGRAGHGMQKNLAQAALNPPQALDATGPGYDAGAALDLDEVHRPGDCIVKVRSCDPVVNGGRSGLFVNTESLHIVTAAPATSAMAPVVWPSGDLANRPWHEADVDGFLSVLPALPSSGAPDWADLAQWYDRLDFGLPWQKSIQYQWTTPYYINGTDEAYGQQRNTLEGTIWAGICGNEWSTSDKTAAVIRMLSNGCQYAETFLAFESNLGEDGGHYQFGIAAALAWLKATGREAQLSALLGFAGGNVLGQYYETQSNTFDVHSSASLPYIARRRTVSAITGSGPYVVTCTDYRPGSGLTGDMASNAQFVDLNMVRESNGATALITAQTASNAAPGTGWGFTVATLPSGLVTSDVIYCAPVTPLSVGVWDWTIRNPVGFPNLPNPAPNAIYRLLNHHGNMILPMSAMGMRSADFDPALEYIQRITAADAYGSLPASVLGSTNTFARTFWSTHQATVLALPQDV
jgi:hypothetical protein